MPQAWKLMTKCRRGDIVLVWFPHSDQATYKKRPVLVVQRDGLNSGISQIVLSMITTNLARLGHPSRVFVPRLFPTGAASGLVADSVIMTDNLATVLEKAINSVVGALPDMAPVDAALRHTLGV
jgi:mRNA interferase MazF